MNLDRFFLLFDCAQSTEENYKYNLGYVREHLQREGITVDDFTVEGFKKYLKTTWDRNTQRHNLVVFHTFLRTMGYGDHPILSYKIPKTPTPPQRMMTPEKLNKLLAACNTKTKAGMQMVVIIHLLWDTWLRENEICNLLVKHLDFGNRKLIALTKGGNWETKIFTENTSAWLEAWLVERIGIARHDCSTVFCNVHKGTPYTKHGFRANMRRLGKKAGFAVSPHDFRRGGVIHALKSGMPDRMAMLQGGWKSEAGFQPYTRNLEIEDVRPFLEKMAAGGVAAPPASFGEVT
jgi:site-specific recombinase XerD